MSHQSSSRANAHPTGIEYAPVWCEAEARKGEWCRKYSYELLRGCSVRQHKWQQLKQTFTPAGGGGSQDE
jgi:hypothetical protein